MRCDPVEACDRVLCRACGNQSSLSALPLCPHRRSLADRIDNWMQSDAAAALGYRAMGAVLFLTACVLLGHFLVGPVWAGLYHH